MVFVKIKKIKWDFTTFCLSVYHFLQLFLLYKRTTMKTFVKKSSSLINSVLERYMFYVVIKKNIENVSNERGINHYNNQMVQNLAA